MVPADFQPLEQRQFDLLLQRSGADPTAFKLRKLVRRDGTGYRVRVAGRGAATVYDARLPGEWTGLFAADLARGLFGMTGTPSAPPAVAAGLAEVEAALVRDGLDGALQVLNRRVPHRFTGVYRLDGAMMRNVALVDKHLHLEPVDLKVVPLKDSFCQFVLRDSVFVTSESGQDDRLVGHPYGGVVGSYVGVPISLAAGSLDGTLCHFDLANHPVADDEFLLLERAARLLPPFLR
jgi:hypothetical protein